MTARKIPYGHSACVFVVLTLFVILFYSKGGHISRAHSFPPISFPTCTVMYIFLI